MFIIILFLSIIASSFPAEIRNISNNSTPSFIAPFDNKPELVPVIVDPIPKNVTTTTVAPEEEDESSEEEESAEDFRYIPGYVTDQGELLVNIKNVGNVKYEVVEVNDG
jgi:hypothetical protein